MIDYPTSPLCRTNLTSQIYSWWKKYLNQTIIGTYNNHIQHAWLAYVPNPTYHILASFILCQGVYKPKRDNDSS
jgi:hypothetical protein